MKNLPRFWVLVSALALIGSLFISGSGARADVSFVRGSQDDEMPLLSGPYDFRNVGANYLTECPQAGLPGNRRDPANQDNPSPSQPRPLDQRQIDTVEQISQQSRNVRVNQDYSCFPQDETSLSLNPCSGTGAPTLNTPCGARNNSNDGHNTKCQGRGKGQPFDCNLNIVAGANDYRQGTGASGFYASTDGGRHWYDGILPNPTARGLSLSAGGDPAIVHDRGGVAYYAELGLSNGDNSNGVFVSRSTNGGFTWSRPCVPFTPGVNPDPKKDASNCGSIGDPRKPGDGLVTFVRDPQDGSRIVFNDKEYIAAGPRPAGVQPQCFTVANNLTRTPTPCDPSVIGVDRLYVTWTVFAADNTFSTINVSYSDDQGRSWSPQRVINGSAGFCVGGADGCSDNQFSTPTVSPVTGILYVVFENFDTPSENQYLSVRSRDGGNTFEGPFFISPVFDVNYPRAGTTRPDCTARGQQRGRSVLTNTCFRVNSGGNVVVDKRGGAFANNLYMVFSDNRNGTPASSNTDVFMFKSTDGGTTWIGPTRVNNDPSTAPANRNCRPSAPGCLGNFGNDQWFPWVDISDTGLLSVGFFDRRLDTNSQATEHPESRQRPGNYLTWFFGASCRITQTAGVPDTGTAVPAGASQCVAPEATVIRQPTGPVDPGTATPPGSTQSTFPFQNYQVSDVPSNMDYSFREGLFIGDYNNVAFLHPSKNAGSSEQSGQRGESNNSQSSSTEQAYGMWTDARNGRGSGNPLNPATNEPGRNPACEQSDVFLDVFPTNLGDEGQTTGSSQNNNQFLVVPCPGRALDSGAHHDDGNNGNNG